jgi:hypothetical protein
VCHTCFVGVERQNEVLRGFGVEEIPLLSMVHEQNMHRSPAPTANDWTNPNFVGPEVSIGHPTSTVHDSSVGAGALLSSQQQQSSNSLHSGPTADAGNAIKLPMEIVHDMATSTCPPCSVASKTSCGNTVTVGKRQPVDETVRVGKKSKVAGIASKVKGPCQLAPRMIGAPPETIIAPLRRHITICIVCGNSAPYAHRCKHCDGAVYVSCSVDPQDVGVGPHYSSHKCSASEVAKVVVERTGGNTASHSSSTTSATLLSAQSLNEHESEEAAVDMQRNDFGGSNAPSDAAVPASIAEPVVVS